MAKICVTRGGCGIVYKDANGVTRYACKTPESGFFECDHTQAERLVHLGVAKYAAKAGRIREQLAADGRKSGQATKSTQRTEKITKHFDAAELETWDYNKLKKFADEIGTEPKSKKKEDLIAAIIAVEAEDDAEDSDELPELGAADPE